ncbi:hypothetical protein J2Z42_001705 [Clostridium algifaecis]|uniref:Uncharacterized protein n=1 Tax=Clostridium algifaecis TaxID=1472040 RepID=A0ABS4KU99_9CLOT|nr:hypothetical protein [Clostridium algifaecis]MBP2033026.1 hypothetical protein [Clostridium algifaecis]
MEKRAAVFMSAFCLILILTGIIIVNNSMPKFIKDKSNFSISCSLSPFDFKINTKNYSINMGGDSLNNFMNKSIKTTEDVGNNIKNGVDGIINSAGRTFNQIKSNIKH